MNKILKVKKVLSVLAFASILLLPSATLAKNDCGKPPPVKPPHGNHGGQGNHGNHGGHCAVPEFSSNAAAGAIALLLGGAFFLLDRRRKVA